MVVLNRIYTRTGDDGETALGNGARVRQAFDAGDGLRHRGRVERDRRHRRRLHAEGDETPSSR